MGALRSRHDIPLEETVKSLQKEIDNAAFLGLKYVMTFGIDEPAQFDHYFQSMARAAAHGAEKGVQVVMKPHGGSSGASDEIHRGHEEGGPPELQDLVRRGQHHLLHGRMLLSGRHAVGDGGQRAREPRVPGESPGGPLTDRARSQARRLRASMRAAACAFPRRPLP